MNVIAVELELSADQYDLLSRLARSRQQSVSAVAQTAIVEWLEWLRRRDAEQAFIDGALTYDQAAAILGPERVEEIEYARRALAQDIARGLEL